MLPKLLQLSSQFGFHQTREAGPSQSDRASAVCQRRTFRAAEVFLYSGSSPGSELWRPPGLVPTGMSSADRSSTGI